MEGALVERRRRQYRGAAGAEGWGLGRRCPLHNGGGIWLKIVHFGVYSDKNSQFIRPIKQV